MRKYEVTINNKLYAVLVKKYSASDAELEINGKPYLVKLDTPVMSVAPPVALPVGASSPPSVQTPAVLPTPVAAAPEPTAKTSSGGAGIVTAPIPGSILDITVKVGDSLKEGQTVVKMEAMKMENDINATIEGTVTAISVKIGDAVDQGQELIIIE